MAQAAAVLKKGEGRMLKAGGPWIFDNEIASLEGSYENGDILEVRDFDVPRVRFSDHLPLVAHLAVARPQQQEVSA